MSLVVQCFPHNQTPQSYLRCLIVPLSVLVKEWQNLKKKK